MRRIKELIEHKEAFTLIELIVVIAVIGILVLLAAPKFLGYTKEAKLAQIKNDVKVTEGILDMERVKYKLNNDNYLLILGELKEDTITVTNEHVPDKKVYDNNGLVSDTIGGPLYNISDEMMKEVGSSLSGSFIANEEGKVYYIEDNGVINAAEPETMPDPEPEIPEDESLATDSDFKWIPSSEDGAYKNNEGEEGYFIYIGTGKKTVEIPHKIQGVEMTSYYSMFYNTGEDVKKVISTNKSVTSMRSMFLGSEATTLDLNSLDTSEVTNMSRIFENSKVGSLALNTWDTSNVTNMRSMFENSKIASLNLSHLDTSKVTEMSRMFGNSKIVSLDLSSFDTSNVKAMNSMFHGSQASELDLSSFDTGNVTDMGFMFQNAQSTSLDLSSFDTGSVKDMSYMFYGSQATAGYARTQADADRFNNSSDKPTELNFIVRLTDDDFEFVEEEEAPNEYMINGVPTKGYFQYTGDATEVMIPDKIMGNSLKSYLGMFMETSVTKVASNNSKVTNMSLMFAVSQTEELDISELDTSNVADMSWMFYGSQIKSLDLSSFYTGSATDMSSMFVILPADNLDVSNFDTSNVTDMSQMFYGVEAETLDLSNFDTSNVTDMSMMFNGSKAETLDLSSFDTSNVTSMNGMFEDSHATSLDLSSFDIRKVSSMSKMFRDSQATELDLSSFDTNNVDYMFDIFLGSQATTGYARSKDDADRFNSSSNRPDSLVFKVKQ